MSSIIPPSFNTLTLIGCGSLGSALLQRLLTLPFFSQGISIVTPRQESAYPFLHDKRVSWVSSDAPYPQSDMYLLAVKPQQLATILPRFAQSIQQSALILSVAAAKSVEFYQSFLGNKGSLVRLMPSTPCRIGKGMVLAYSQDPSLSSSTLSSVLKAWGDVIWTPSEDHLDRLATLCACGPAFVYYVMEAFTHAANILNVSDINLSTLVSSLFQGSLDYLDSQKASPQALRTEVTSPQGITAAGLKVLQNNNNLINLFTDTLQASLQRTYELQHDQS